MVNTYVDADGYRKFDDSDKPVHWWVMDKKIGRANRIRMHKKGYHIHHIDGDKLNNDPDNLEMIPGDIHEEHHTNIPGRMECWECRSGDLIEEDECLWVCETCGNVWQPRLPRYLV